MRVYVGVSIESDAIRAALFDVYGKRLKNLVLERNDGTPLADLEDDLLQAVESMVSPEIYELQTIGIGVNSADYYLDENIFSSENGFYHNSTIRRKFSEKFGRGVVVSSNIDCAIYGAFKELDIAEDMAMGLYVGERVGGAVIFESRLYEGRVGPTNFGKLILQPDGTSGDTEYFGSLISFASRRGIQDYIAKQYKKGRDSYLGEPSTKERLLPFKSVVSAYEKEDRVTTEAIERAYRFLGIGLHNMVCIVKPQVIILSGEFFDYLGNEALEKIKMYIEQIGDPEALKKVKIYMSDLKEIGSVYGAYRLALDADIGSI